MLKKFKISWKEEHSIYQEAETEEIAVQLALGAHQAPSCDYQSIHEIKEVSNGND